MADHTEGAVLKTLVITDLVLSTKLTEEWGGERTSEIIGKQDRLARDLLAEHNGVEIDKTDRVSRFFQRPIEAVRLGLAITWRLTSFPRTWGSPSRAESVSTWAKSSSGATPTRTLRAVPTL
jgi:hypothetical protein